MKLRRSVFLAAIGVAGVVAPGPARALPVFALDPLSPSAAMVSPADVLVPGPVGGPPTVLYSGAALGLLPGDALNALATFPVAPSSTAVPYFTVDRATIGLPVGAPDVFSEAAAGQAAGDVFSDPTGGTVPPFNTLAVNQHALGLMPAIPPGVPFPGPIDHLSALDLRVEPDLNGDGVPDLPLLITLAPGSPTLGLLGLGPADVLFAGGIGFGVPPSLAIPAAGLGLGPGDVVDGLDIDFGLLFSLAPGSPSLGLNSPADILLAPGVPVFGPSVGSLGLLPFDNVTDFAFASVPEVVPTAGLLGLVFVGLVFRRQRKAG